MNLYTSYFAKTARLPQNIIPISISLWPPKNWTGKTLPKLAPTREILTAYKQDADWAAYTQRYNTQILAKYRPEQIVQEIIALSDGRDAALICFEKDPIQCHRTLVAQWLRTAGYQINELAL